MNKLLNFVKKHKILTAFSVIVLVIVGYAVAKPPKEIKRDYATLAPLTITQEIDVTGRVEPTTAVELAIQSGGKVGSVGVTVGQSVKAGQMLVSVNSADLQVRLAKQQASLEKAKIVLTKQESKTTYDDNLNNAYKEGLNVVSETYLDLTSIVSGIDTIWTHQYLAENTITLRYGSAAQKKQMNAKNQYYDLKSAYEKLSQDYRVVTRESDTQAIESLINHAYDVTKIAADSVKSVNTFLDFIEIETERNVMPPELASDRAAVNDYTQQINLHLSRLLEIKNKIKDSITNINDEGRDVESIKLDIRQAQLDIEDTLVQINNRSIFSPINGVITDVRAKVGETISAATPVVALISANQYQIEVNLPESEIAKVKIGAEADVTLDAYGDDALFRASVVSIDPTATLLNGVATYKTTLQFSEKDDRIKGGMTADVNIKGERKEGVLGVPQRAIINKNDKKYVQVMEGENVVEKEVETGLRGSNGNVEITQGLSEGDKIVVFVESK